MNNKRMPCPFCGGTGIYLDTMRIDGAINYFYACKDCAAEGPNSPFAAVAGAYWDIRQLSPAG